MNGSETYTIKNIGISQDVIDFLSPSKTGPYSRCDAFHNLILRATSSGGSVTFMGQELDLLPGEFAITVTELSKLWGWERKTVKNFIDELGKLGMLQTTYYKKFYIVDMVALNFESFCQEKFICCEFDWQSLQRALDHYLSDLESMIIPSSFIAECDPAAVSPYVDSIGRELYSAAQRVKVARCFQETCSPIICGVLKDLYTPKVEKSMLDTFYKVCDGDDNLFKQILRSVFTGCDKVLLDNASKAYAQVLVIIAETLSSLSKNAKAPDSNSNTPEAEENT